MNEVMAFVLLIVAHGHTISVLNYPDEKSCDVAKTELTQNDNSEKVMNHDAYEYKCIPALAQ